MKFMLRCTLPKAAVACFASVAMASATAVAEQVVVTFDELTLAPDSYNTGPMPGAIETQERMWGVDVVVHRGPFETQGAAFENRLVLDAATGGQVLWSGFAYSNQNDRTTAGYLNQYSVFAEGGGLNAVGAPDGGNFAVASGYRDAPFEPQTPADLEGLPTFALPFGATIEGIYVANTTYAALSMLHGDGFAKRFGGDDGDDPDWFKLTAYGYANGELKSVEFFLADFRFDDDELDYVLNAWEYMDLSDLAGATRISFNLTSSDAGVYGMNTPGAFAIDDVTYSIGAAAVPEPAGLLTAAVATVALSVMIRRRSAA